MADLPFPAPSPEPGAPRPVGVDALAAQLQQRAEKLSPTDPAGLFTGVYLRMTHAVGEEIARGGFLDGEWVDRLDAAFGDLYLAPFDAHRAGQPVSKPWAIAFELWESGRHLRPLNHVLVGINAHINYDLPQALLQVMPDAEFDDEAQIRRRDHDHRQIDRVLGSRIAEEDELLAGLGIGRVDQLLRPLNRTATMRFLHESRAKVWSNTRILAAARRQGSEQYASRLAALEQLSAQRVADLVRPGQVLLRLARVGFGVRLPPPG